MDRLTRFDPFADLDDMFRGLMLRPIRLEAPSPQIRIDVTENDGAYTVHAEIPGVKRDEIRVDVDGNTISIAAEVHREKDKKGDRMIRCERSCGSMTRTFTLPHEVDQVGAKAHYSDGVLELTLPKRSRSRPSAIAIQ
ncbi:MAG: Hsp20/alpha crystallin family protein [Burkholderiales bacterium]|nr:Hsp20/alpha crystallin family protein [Burkholderiales bacterium]